MTQGIIIALAIIGFAVCIAAMLLGAVRFIDAVFKGDDDD